MISISETFGSLSSLLCLSLLHFLWQGVAIALTAVVAGLILRRRSAQAEYIALVVGLALFPAAFAATLVWQATMLPPATEPMTTQLPATAAAPSSAQPELAPRPIQPIAAAESEPTAKVGPASDAAPTAPAAWDWHSIAPWLGAIYLFGVLAMCIRLLIGLGGARRLCRAAARVEDQGVLESLARQCRRVGLRLAPPIAYCRDVSVPTLVGILRPTILLPLSAVSGLLPAELESILLHELVHIRRYDHLLNLAQRLVEAAFFFHPAVWFLSRRITVVREHCCDDAVLTLGTQRAVYIESLMRVAELSVAASGLVRHGVVAGLYATDKPSRLRRRIARLLDPPGPSSLRLKPAALLFVGALLIGSLTTPLLLTALACPRQHRDQRVGAVGDPPPADNKNAIPKTPHKQPLHFSGIVVDKVTQQPISRAIVTILRRGATRPDQILLEDIAEPDDIVTDANGRYEFTIAAERATDNRFMVGVGAQGSLHAPRNPAFDRISLILDDIKKGQHPWFEKIDLAPGETVAGVIADPQGKPLANCVISFFSSAAQVDPGVTGYFTAAGASPMDKSAGSTTTDASGRFSFQAIKRAQTVVFSAQPSNFAAFCHDVGKQRGDLGVFRVTPGTRLTGTVVDELGKPLGGIRLTVESDSRGSSGMGTDLHTMTDDRGRFAFEPVEDGGFQVTVFEDGRFIPVHVDASAQKPVGSIDFRPAPMTTLRIHFRNRAGKPSTATHGITFDGWKGKAQYVTMLHSSHGEAEGRVPKGMERSELQGVWSPEYLMFWRIGEHGNLKLGAGYSIPLEALSGDLTEITVIETKSPRLTVRAVGPDGKPITKFLPRIQYKDPTLNRRATAPLPNGVKGDVVFGGATSREQWITWSLQPDQEFTVTAEAPGYQPASQTLKLAEGENREITLKLAAETKKSSSDAPIKTGVVERRADDVSASSPIVLAADDKTTGESKNTIATAQNPPAQPLHFSGIVVDKFTQKRVAGATVKLHRMEEGKHVEIEYGHSQWKNEELGKPEDIVTDGNGRYEFSIAAEQAADPRLQLATEVRHPHYLHGPPNWEHASISSVLANIREGKHSWFEKIELLPTRTVSGVIVDPTGQPLPRCEVMLISAKRRKPVSSAGGKALTWTETSDKKLVDYGWDTTNTDAQGRFNLQAIQGAELAKIWAGPQDFVVLEREIDPIVVQLGTLKVETGARVAGTVVDEHEKPLVGVAVGCLPLDERNWHSVRTPHSGATTDQRGQFSLAPVAFGKYQVGVGDGRFVPIQVELLPDKPLAPITFRPHPLATVRVNFVDRAGKPSALLHSEISISGSMAKVPYSGRLRRSLGHADGEVPIGLENSVLEGIGISDYLVSWRMGDQGKLQPAGYSPEGVKLGAINGPTEITVVETKLPTLLVRAVGTDGKPIMKFLPRIDYKDPALTRHKGPFKNGAKGDVSMTESTPTTDSQPKPGQWFSFRLLFDQEFTVTAEATGFQSASRSLKMAEGETREITLTLVAETKKSSSDAPIKSDTAMADSPAAPSNTPRVIPTGGIDILMLLTDDYESVRKALKFSSEQQAVLNKLAEDIRAFEDQLHNGGAGAAQTDLESRVEAFRTQTRHRLYGVLTAEQWEQLGKLAFQGKAPDIPLRTITDRALQLTPDQFKRRNGIQALEEAQTDALQQAVRNGELTENSKTSREIRENCERFMLDVLSPEQRAKLDKMRGMHPTNLGR